MILKAIEIYYIYLLLYFSMILIASSKFSTNATTKMLFLLRNLPSKPFSKKTLENLRFLLIISEVSLKGIPSIS